MMNLHKFLSNSNELSVQMTAGFSVVINSFPSLEKFLFCTDKIEFIEWQDLVPRLRIGDCFEIHLPL